VAKHADVLVIGAGPAGIATAIAASLKGLRVSVLDYRKPPIQKSCGEGLLPTAVTSLQSLGIHLTSNEGFPFRGIRFSDEEFSASARITKGRDMESAAPSFTEFWWNARAKWVWLSTGGSG